MIYGLLSDPDARVRRAALHTLNAVELDRARLADAATALERSDTDDQLRAYVRDHHLASKEGRGGTASGREHL